MKSIYHFVRPLRQLLKVRGLGGSPHFGAAEIPPRYSEAEATLVPLRDLEHRSHRIPDALLK